MEQIILQVLVASGVIGFSATYVVAGAKWIANNWKISINPRLMLAIFTIVTSIVTVINGDTVDMSGLEEALTVIIMAVVSAVIGHTTHKVNGI